jgi:hypothetical protein
MLKVLLGGVASKSFAQDGELLTEWNQDVDKEHLIEVLFRGALLPDELGLCVLPYQGDEMGRQRADDAPNMVGVVPVSSDRGGLVGLTVRLGAIHFSFVGVQPQSTLMSTVGGIAIERTSPFVEKLFAFAWPRPTNAVMRLSDTPTQ